MAYSVGIDLGGTRIKAALVERNIGVIERKSIDTQADDGPDAVLDRIADLITAMKGSAPDGQIAGVGLGAPGAVTWERDTVRGVPNLPGWEKINVRKRLQERLGHDFYVIVENDANLAGLGSAHYGAGRPHDSFIFVTLGTGVGGAIIYNNTIFRGSTGGAGEIGHMTIDYAGPLDYSGVAGAVEAYVGQRFLSEHAYMRLRVDETSSLYHLGEDALQDITPKMLFDAANAGDEAAKNMLAWAGHKLGCVLGSAINLLDIRKVIIGGGVSAAGDYILQPAFHSMRQFVMTGLRDGLELIQETLGNEVGILGAAHVVFEYLDENNGTNN